MIYPNIISLAVFVILSLGLTGCTETIRMKNQATGEVAECGAHPLLLPIYAMVAQGHDHQCVQDYKDQGFVRAAAEWKRTMNVMKLPSLIVTLELT